MNKPVLHWRRGRRPAELSKAIFRDFPHLAKQAFIRFIQRTARRGSHGYWPVDTGLSRDSFVWYGDALVSTDYAPYANHYYGNVLESMWRRWDPNEELQRVVNDHKAGPRRFF